MSDSITHAPNPTFVDAETGRVIVAEPNQRVTTRNGVPELEYRTGWGQYATFAEVVASNEVHRITRMRLEDV